MLPSNDNEYCNVMGTACSTLTDQYMFSAYPQLSGPMYAFSSSLMNGFVHQLNLQCTEALTGVTPWAKLYKMMTGHTIEIPKGIVENYRATGRMQTSSPIPITAILDYYNKYRKTRHIAYKGVSGENGLQVDISTDTGEVAVHWTDNDMTLRLQVGTNLASAHCPLFHEPYQIVLVPAFVEDYITVPLLKEIVGNEAVESFDKAHLAMDHVCREIEIGETLHEDNYAMRLMGILGDYKGFGEAGASRVHYVVNDHRITLKLDCDFYTGHGKGHGFKGLVISDVSQITEDEKLNTVYNWEKNPLLVQDILSNLNPAIRKFVEQHERETTE